ncbi:hypothetical protein [Gottfriedia acidiceleris]|uniref:hypothetical protein n=1 Tax=Gottfriedia acidiceleris TaxID=371036 RepID=UPI002FFE1DD1
MKGLYICVGQQLNDKSSGIGRKINNQVHALEKKEYNVDLINIDNKTTLWDKFLFFAPFFKSEFQKRQISAVDGYNLKDYQFVYIRKPALSSAIITLLKNIKRENPKIKVIMEIPTYPIYGEYQGLRKSLILQSILVSGSIKKYVDRIATYSNDKKIWGVKTINISNCVDFSVVKPKKVNTDEGSINLIAVALFSHWHGYDRFIEGLHLYYKNGGKRKVEIYLVGDSDIVPIYKNLVQKYDLTEYIHFCGKQYGDQLDKIYDKCEIGLDALARHRSKVYFNSSLKGKEYGAKGLPIISGVETELDSDSNYKYYLRVPADDTPIDIYSIIEFYDFVYKGSESKEQIINSIRTYSQNHFDFMNGFQPVINFIKN